MIKKTLITFGLASTLTCSSLSAFAADFSDIQGHWAESTIEWGKQNGYVSGYEDGTFQPDKQVTEAEFTTMLIATFHLKLDHITPQNNWADDFYAYAKKMNYPLSGYDDLNARNQPISRTNVAQMVAAVQGQNLTGEEAIKYLLVNGFSHGKTSSTVEGYSGNDNLTRAEAITFIKNLLDKGLTSPQVMPSTPTNTTQLDQQYQQMVQQQQPSQTTQPTQPTTQSTTWTPGAVSELGVKLFSTYIDNGNSVTVTMPTIDDYTFGAEYYTAGYKATDPNYKSFDLEEGKTYNLQKGEGGKLTVAIQGTNGANVEAYSIRIDDGLVSPMNIHQWTPIASIFKGLGVN